MILFSLSILLFIDLLLERCGADPDVKFSIVMFRHGERTPLSTFPTDPWQNYSAWSIGFGQLSDKGKLRLFKLGQFLRRRYNHLLSEEYKPDEIFVRSTDSDRTIMSAMAFLAGKYPVNKENECLPGVAWKPIPVHAVPVEHDIILGKISLCQRYHYELYKLFLTPEYTKITRELEPLFEYLTNWTGEKISSMQDVSKIYDTLNVEDTLYNLRLPNWTKTVYPQQMKETRNKYIKTLTYTSMLKRLKSGPTIEEITNLLRAAASDKPKYNVVVFSAHDVTLVNTLDSLGLSKIHFPGYGATLLIELLNDTNGGEDFVRLTYQNEVLEIPYCGKHCPISEWVLLYSWLMPVDYDLECRLNSKRKRKYLDFKRQFKFPGSRFIDSDYEV